MTETSLAGMVDAVDDGATIALGGKTLHRAPMAFIRELVRAGVDDLTLVGLANSMDVDLLCGSEQVGAVHYGYVGFEWMGLAPNFRAAAEARTIEPVEGTCYSVATMLRAARQGVPFLPIAGLDGSDLIETNPTFETIEDPFSGQTITAVRRLHPDIAVVHASEADEAGNARFDGADLTERLLARSAERVFVTAERLVDTGPFEADPERTAIPGFLVDHVAAVPYGAHPLSMPGKYGYDTQHLQSYLDRSPEDVEGYYEKTIGSSEARYRSRWVDERADDLAWEGPMPDPVIGR